MTYSFDIFDTCLVRKCGTPENMLDVLSLRVFKEPVEEWVRQEFVVARKAAQDKVWSENSFITLEDIYNALDFQCPQLKKKEALIQIEKDLEKELLVPVLKMRRRIDMLRSKGNHIIYISDMYLPDELIRNIMVGYGFLKESDTLYVSGTIGKLKQNGSLFEYVRGREGLSFRHWKHIGDSKHNDYAIPRKLGIKAELVNWGYNPYPNYWRKNDYSLGFKYPSIIAGLNRALSLCNDENTHRDFVLDIIAPFYCSWVYQILDDANRRGIKRLYFCARDAYQIHKIALEMQPLFPEIGIEYVYMSRQSLYLKRDNDAAKLDYYKRIGLATKSEKIAIVDTTSTGKTLLYLNEILQEAGFDSVFGYYIMLWHPVKHHEMYYSSVFDDYILLNKSRKSLWGNLFVFENFFSLNNDKKNIDYKFINEIGEPIFDNKQGKEDAIYLYESNDWATEHEKLLIQYAKEYIGLGIKNYSTPIFQQIAMPTLWNFITYPEKDYLEPLINYYSYFGEYSKKYVSYISKTSLVAIYLHLRRNFAWRRGTIVYNTPKWLNKIFKYIKETNE